jgi:hypothetical protein
MWVVELIVQAETNDLAVLIEICIGAVRSEDSGIQGITEVGRPSPATHPAATGSGVTVKFPGCPCATVASMEEPESDSATAGCSGWSDSIWHYDRT